ncbi:O-antigen ligase family protein [Leifsonia sp. NPDC080035]|uniref:O-antigen ligase family protein n=1 Tax=Leifsonia sp. NPDC080035 TaxID=3143936 RepID=A0AAU7GEX3_9MICO
MSNVIWIGSAVVLAIAATILACAGNAGVVLAGLAIVALLITLGFPRARAVFFAAAGCLLIVFASSVFIPDDGATASIALRVAGTVLLVGGAIQSAAHGFTASRAERRLVFAWLMTLLVPVALYITLATIPHSMWATFLSYGIGVILMAAIVTSSAPQLASGTLRQAVVLALATTIIASLLAGFLIPDLAIEQGRLRGVLNNANLLGFYAFLLGVVALTLVKRAPARWGLLGVSAITLLWTASRASTLALVIAVIVLILFTRFATGVLVAGALALVGVCVGLVWPNFFDLFDGIVRGNNSRSGSWDVAVSALNLSPWSGVGLGNEASIIASSPLRAAADAGYPGLITIAILWLAMLVLSARIGGRVFALTVAAVIHSCFEGWLLSPVGPMILIFAMTWLTIADLDIGRRNAPLASSTPTGLPEFRPQRATA